MLTISTTFLVVTAPEDGDGAVRRRNVVLIVCINSAEKDLFHSLYLINSQTTSNIKDYVKSDILTKYFPGESEYSIKFLRIFKLKYVEIKLFLLKIFVLLVGDDNSNS